MAECINFALIGCGFIGKLHGDIISHLPGARLAAVVDCNETVAVRLAEKYQCACYQKLEPVLNNPDIHAVSICLPPGLHCETVLACAAAGKAVLCEKPLEIDVERGRKMVEACREKGVPFGVIMQHRFDEPVIKIREAIADGSFGRLLWGVQNLLVSG